MANVPFQVGVQRLRPEMDKILKVPYAVAALLDLDVVQPHEITGDRRQVDHRNGDAQPCQVGCGDTASVNQMSAARSSRAISAHGPSTNTPPLHMRRGRAKTTTPGTLTPTVSGHRWPGRNHCPDRPEQRSTDRSTLILMPGVCGGRLTGPACPCPESRSCWVRVLKAARESGMSSSPPEQLHRKCRP